MLHTKHCDFSVRTGNWTKRVLCSAAVVGSIKGISGLNGQCTGDIFTRVGGTDGDVSHGFKNHHLGAIWKHFGPGDLWGGLSSGSAAEDGRIR